MCSEVRKRYNLQIGTRTGKRLKLVMGRLADQHKQARKVVGIDSVSGLPREEVISAYVVDVYKRQEYNQMKVLLAMQKNRVSEECFGSSSGYGYNDYGRDTLEKVYADTFHTEACLVRPQIACGTHALAIALFGNLRPGDEMLAPAGKPYDCLLYTSRCV